MLDAFQRLPDGAYAPTPMPSLASVASAQLAVKVERVNEEMAWCPHSLDWPPHLGVHLPLRGTIHFRVEDGPEVVCGPGQLLLDRRPQRAGHQNVAQQGIFRNCWCHLAGTAVLAAADAAIATHGVLIDLAQRPEIWRQIHEWFGQALRERRADESTLGSLAFVWLTRLCAWRSPSGIAAALELIERCL